MSNDSENYFYRIHYKSRTASFWHVVHTIQDVTNWLESREADLSGVEITLLREYGWDEQERKELERLKKKYEPEEEL